MRRQPWKTLFCFKGFVENLKGRLQGKEVEGVSYKYKLTKDNRKNSHKRYTLDELQCMGTFLLRDICVREKIMTQRAGIDPQNLNREALIELLYRYRGRKEETLTEDFPEESVLLLKELLSKTSLAAEPLVIPYKLELTKEVPLLKDQEVRLQHGFSGSYLLGLLTDSQGEIWAVAEVIDNCITLSPKRMRKDLEPGTYQQLEFLLFNAASSLRVMEVYNTQKCDPSASRGLVASKAPLPILTVWEAEEAKEPLVIDFGAANTCVSSEAADKILNVSFLGGGGLCPSVAAVWRCNKEGAAFRFGHEALKIIKRDGYGSSMTFLHNLKLYLYKERTLNLCDCEGNAVSVSSDLVLKEFFEYVICLARAEHRRSYSKLAFLLPEKRGRLALKRLQEILPEYQVISAGTESLNSVYLRVAENIEDQPEDNIEKELAFHCGGGSSSLVSCGYTIENTNVAYRVRLKERYINGDCGFGGNDLTYLILKYLKIKVMWELKGFTEPVLDEPFTEAYSYVDEYGGTKEIYHKFNLLYEEANEVVPTDFDRLEETASVKRQNFYRLWFLAEGLKKAFFSDQPVSVIRLPDRFFDLCAVNAVYPEGIKDYLLDFQVDKEELQLLLAPEIYRLVKSFIEPLCEESGILTGYRIKFTGLSCRIPIFRDALREFTVGRRARAGKGNPLGLKLGAAKGAVLREQMLKSGRIIPKITREADQVSYTVAVETHDGFTRQIVSGKQEEGSVFGYVSRHIATRVVDFSICDAFGNLVRTRKLDLDIRGFVKTGYDLLFETYPFLREVQGDIDSIDDDEIRLFVFRDEGWDFSVLPVARRAESLWTCEVRRFLFDDESADYFCGRY